MLLPYKLRIMKLTPAWRNRSRNLTTIFLVLTVVAIIYTLIQWIRSEPGSFEPLNVLFFAVFSVASAISAWLSRPDNVQPPASSEIALAETPAFGPLRQQITNLFSLDELHVLCFDLGIRYDDLSGDTISTKSVSLLAYAHRRGQLDQLMSALQRERPRAKWPVPHTLQTLYDLRRNVRATWIDGVLKQSVTDEIALELNLTLEPHVLTRKVAYVPGQANKPTEKDVPQLFADFGSLLILGEPGSGKTTTLLQLAESLLNDAEQDAMLLTPVILNLASWASEQKLLTEWLVEELWQQYQLPLETGRTIIQNNQLIYLLDGLDEVAEAAREACVKEINLFREHNSGGLAVCCRATEYEALPYKLNLGMGVRIQPLADAQVADYFKRPELALEAVSQLLETDEALQKLAQTPLFLSMMTLAYQGLSQDELNQLETEATRRDHLYSFYVAEMFKRRPLLKDCPYELEQAQKCLIHLAYEMKKYDLTLFYLEGLPPTWLLSRELQLRYLWLVRIVGRLIFGLTGGLISGLIFGLIFGLIGGLIFGLLFGLIFGIKYIQTYERTRMWSLPRDLFEEIRFGLRVGLIFGLTGGLISGLIDGLIWGLGDSLFIGLLGALIFALIFGLGDGLAGTLFVRQRSRSLVPKIHGIGNSLPSSFLITIFYGLIFGLSVGLSVPLVLGLIFGLTGRLVHGLIAGLFIGLFLGLAFGLIRGFFRYGGQSFIQHYLGRKLLAHSRILPFSVKTDHELTGFLDAMKDRILLRRVGSGWIFIHRTLQDFFASRHPDAQIEVNNE